MMLYMRMHYQFYFQKINEINADSSIVGLRCLSQKVPKGSNSIKDFHQDMIQYITGMMNLLVVFHKKELIY